MNDDMKKRSEEVALFRFGVIGDLVHLPPGAKGLYRAAQGEGRNRLPDPRLASRPGRARDDPELAQGVPQGRPRRAPASTARRPWPLARPAAGGLGSPPRHQGRQPRSLGPARHPRGPRDREGAGGAPARADHGAPAALARRADGARSRTRPASKDHRRFAFEKAGDLWMSDVMHGPAVTVAGKKRKTYLIAFIDDATRVVPYAAFTLAENTAAFLPVLKQAVLRRGVPQSPVRRQRRAPSARTSSRSSARSWASPSSTPGRTTPQAKGKQERWFRTVRMQLLPRLTAGRPREPRRAQPAPVDLGRGRVPPLAAPRPRRAQTPLDRWAQRRRRGALPRHGDLDDLFLPEAKRKVAKDRTVSLDGIVYEVDASLVGEMVTLRYDPSKPGRARAGRGHEGARARNAKVVDVYANCFVKRDRPAKPPEAAPPRPTSRTKGGVTVYRKHFGLTRHPFAKDLAPEDLFASAAGDRARGPAPPPPRPARHRPRHRRARQRQDHHLPQGGRLAPLRPLPRPLRAALHRQRDGHVQVHRLGAGPRPPSAAAPRSTASSAPR